MNCRSKRLAFSILYCYPNPSFLSVMMGPSLTFVISEVGDFCNNQLHRLVARFYLEGNSVNMGAKKKME